LPLSDLATLCQSCGLCCDGSLFGRVDLERDEVGPMRKKRLRVASDGRTFEQPCPALAPCESGVDGHLRACSIYDERPASCRTFVCRLYDRHEREGGPLAPRLAAVRRIRELVAALEAEGLTPRDFEPGRRTSRPSVLAIEMFAELTKRLEDDFARARSS
jgi:Fe-S-cluster containining protein